MNNLKLAIVLTSIILLSVVSVSRSEIPPAGMQALQQFSATARYWTTANQFDTNYGGYQTSSAEWTALAFY